MKFGASRAKMEPAGGQDGARTASTDASNSRVELPGEFEGTNSSESARQSTESLEAAPDPPKKPRATIKRPKSAYGGRRKKRSKTREVWEQQQQALQQEQGGEGPVLPDAAAGAQGSEEAAAAAPSSRRTKSQLLQEAKAAKKAVRKKDAQVESLREKTKALAADKKALEAKNRALKRTAARSVARSDAAVANQKAKLKKQENTSLKRLVGKDSELTSDRLKNKER